MEVTSKERLTSFAVASRAKRLVMSPVVKTSQRKTFGLKCFGSSGNPKLQSSLLKMLRLMRYAQQLWI